MFKTILKIILSKVFYPALFAVHLGLMYYTIQAAIISLSNRNLFFYSSGARKFKIKVPANLFSGEDFLQGLQTAAVCVFTWPPLSVCMQRVRVSPPLSSSFPLSHSPHLSLYMTINAIGLGQDFYDFFNLNYLLKSSTYKYSLQIQGIRALKEAFWKAQFSP
jgi:hypothetical protein